MIKLKLKKTRLRVMTQPELRQVVGGAGDFTKVSVKNCTTGPGGPGGIVADPGAPSES